ncbi:MAG: lamin tail domain-containing protein, partial [Bacteroidales bacterium]|nr:lamin tail domain-containing protein [Bacteroidales bacterium]
HIYSAVISAPLSSAGTVDFNISAEDIDTNTSLEPVNGMYSIVIPEASDLELYINEFMASNSNTIADEFGEYDDWVEIYNAGTESVWLGDKYMSDDHLNPSKWQMPDVEIHSGDFLLFWTDNDPEQGDFHTSFKLSAGGEEIGIYDSESTNYAEIDFIEFGEQTTDVSMGRIPDGTGEVAVLPYATPGYSNTSTISVSALNNSGVTVFPNPFNHNLFLSFNNNTHIKKAIVKITDISGKRIFEKIFFSPDARVQILSGNHLKKAGIYILTVNTKDISGAVSGNRSRIIIKK